MINALFIGVGFALIVVQGMVQHIVVFEWLYPSFILPLVLFMAVGQFSLARGASLSFVLGYLTDAFSGLPMGLFTFSMVAIFLLSRVAGLKLFLHGVVFQVLLTFVASVAVGMMIMGLHLIFERTNLAVQSALMVVLAQSAATAVVSPVVFELVSRLPGAEPVKAEEA